MPHAITHLFQPGGTQDAQQRQVEGYVKNKLVGVPAQFFQKGKIVGDVLENVYAQKQVEALLRFKQVAQDKMQAFLLPRLTKFECLGGHFIAGELRGGQVLAQAA